MAQGKLTNRDRGALALDGHDSVGDLKQQPFRGLGQKSEGEGRRGTFEMKTDCLGSVILTTTSCLPSMFSYTRRRERRARRRTNGRCLKLGWKRNTYNEPLSSLKASHFNSTFNEVTRSQQRERIVMERQRRDGTDSDSAPSPPQVRFRLSDLGLRHDIIR